MTDTTPDRIQDQIDPNDAAFRAGKTAAENRWLLLAVGCATLVAGFIAVMIPFWASITAALVVGWVLIASGAVGLITAVRRNTGWPLAAAFVLSLLSVVAGTLMIVQPLTGIIALTTVMIAYFAASGAVRVFYGLRALRDRAGASAGWMAASGVLSVLLAVLLFFGLPFSAAWLPGVMLGLDLILWGVLLIGLALHVGRSVPRKVRDAQPAKR